MLLILAGKPPRPVATPPLITVKHGDPASFHCDANSDTPAEIHWGFGRDVGPLRGDVIQEGDDVVIDSADDLVAGEYVCTATNEFGSGRSEPVRLVVTEGELCVCNYPLFKDKACCLAYFNLFLINC